MTWYSLLPEKLTAFEGWLTRFFIILGTLTIGPWAFLILYDILLYIWRATTYEIPIIGGRARGRRRPVAPSLSERPSGRRRAFSLTGTTYDGGKEEHLNEGTNTPGRSSSSSSSSELLLQTGNKAPESDSRSTGNGSGSDSAGEVKRRRGE
ncbi:hypothetical protein PRK78_000563 [Emydomyces testavorans]|uniref:Uncharacterized protein n=1 Tax=Emydomyces testavorans TaxID=2070801 RepID=A0AAF0IEK5_9EURO|nr:hypothetical protein PRK78_000563 [Emydomyces testavorans]